VRRLLRRRGLGTAAKRNRRNLKFAREIRAERAVRRFVRRFYLLRRGA
jgi:hypothetical protein